MSLSKTFPDAAVLGKTQKLHDLLQAGANVHEVDSKGRTALFRTCRLGQAEKALLLLAAGADPNATDHEGEAPLQAAARYGHLECIRILLNAGANINYCPPPSLTAFSESALCSAVRKSPDAARFMLAHQADPNVATDAKNYPLLSAIDSGHPELVSALLAHNASVAVSNERGESALHRALHSGNEKTVAELLKAGANVNAKDTSGDTPIFFGLTSEMDPIPAICELLAWKPDLAVTDSVMGMTPLELAIERDLPKIAALLRKFGAPNPRTEVDQQTVTITITAGKLAAIRESRKIKYRVASAIRNFEGQEEIEDSAEFEDTDWRDSVERLDSKVLEPTADDLAMARQADEESPSLFHVFGYQASAPHMWFLRKSSEPTSLIRMAFFARGFLNAPEGRELQDGQRELGESYQSAAQRFVDLGFLRKVDETRAIALSHTTAELSAIAKKSAIKGIGTVTKQELSERLFGMLGIAPFAARLETTGGYFEVTPAGAKETDRFDENRSRFVAQQIAELLDAVTQSNFIRAAKIARVLVFLKKYTRSTPIKETDPRNIACARCIRTRKIPTSLVVIPDLETRYLVIASAYVLCRWSSTNWDFWDDTIKPLKSAEGEIVDVSDLADALLECE
jgi:ankyrin repeat protein